MKNIYKIIALLLILSLVISNTFAESLPEEPMVIYGEVSGLNNNTSINIYDGNGNIKASITVLDYKYGTNKTFDLDNKISIGKFDGQLNFSTNGYNLNSVIKGSTNNCESTPTFQNGNICEYNLSFSKISNTSGGGGGGGGGGYSKKRSIINISGNTGNIIKDSNIKNTIKSEETIEIKSNIKRNESGKIIIKGTDYIKTLKNFNENMKKENEIFGYKVLNIKGNDLYNKNIENYTKEIYNNIKLDGNRKSIIKSMDNMTKTYGILLNNDLNKDLKEIYTAKLKDDKEYFELKMKKIKRKDEIIRYVLEKRKK